MSAVCGVFLFALIFLVPGAWIHRANIVLGKKPY